MSGAITDTVIVLRARPLRDADLMLTVFAAHAGKLAAVAGHARRSRKRFGGALAVGTCGNATWQPIPGSNLVRLSELSPLWTPPLQSASMAHFAALHLLLLVVDATTGDAHADPDKFVTLSSGLPRLTTSAAPAAHCAHLLAHWLHCCGYALTMDRCVHCQRDIDAAAPHVHFAPRDGGLRCHLCPATSGWTLPLPATTAQHWAQLLATPDAPLSPIIIPLLRVGLAQYVAQLVGKPLLSGPYWDMLWDTNAHAHQPTPTPAHFGTADLAIAGRA